MTALIRLRPYLPGRRAAAFGAAAAAALLLAYLTIISVAQGAAHALEQLGDDLPFVLALTAGFGIQVALFTELRAAGRRHRAGAVVTAASTGTSTAAMLACCAHHLADILPLVGLSAAAVLLDQFRTPLFLVSLSLNAAGIVVIARRLGAARRACPVARLVPSPAAGA